MQMYMANTSGDQYALKVSLHTTNCLPAKEKVNLHVSQKKVAPIMLNNKSIGDHSCIYKNSCCYLFVASGVQHLWTMSTGAILWSPLPGGE